LSGLLWWVIKSIAGGGEAQRMRFRKGRRIECGQKGYVKWHLSPCLRGFGISCASMVNLPVILELLESALLEGIGWI
jgi:hypothetical protein